MILLCFVFAISLCCRSSFVIHFMLSYWLIEVILVILFKLLSFSYVFFGGYSRFTKFILYLSQSTYTKHCIISHKLQSACNSINPFNSLHLPIVIYILHLLVLYTPQCNVHIFKLTAVFQRNEEGKKSTFTNIVTIFLNIFIPSYGFEFHQLSCPFNLYNLFQPFL